MEEFFNLQQTVGFEKEGQRLIPYFKNPTRSSLTDNEIFNFSVIKKYSFSVKAYLDNPPVTYSKVVAVDVETTGLDFTQDSIRLIAIYGEDFEYVGEDLDEVKSLLVDPNVLLVFHNSKFDVCFLKKAGIEVNNFTDTFIMNQILMNQPVFESLSRLAKIYLGETLDKSLQHADNWMGDITDDHRAYCLADARITYQLYLCMFDLIVKRYLYPRYKLEIDALPALIEMTLNGMWIDWQGYSSYLNTVEKEMQQIESVLKFKLCCKNLNSNTQLLSSLNAIGIPLDSVKEEELKLYSSKYPIVEEIVEYKRRRKLLTSYGTKLKAQLHEDRRLRGSWNLIGAKTSRMSCNKPNFQSIPKDMKRFFKAEEGQVFVIMDYCAIEIIILAEISNCQNLINSLNAGVDLHEETARAVLNKKLVSKDERQLGKIFNFGLIFGMGPYSLKQKINAIPGFKINEYEAEEFIENYFKMYPEVAKYQQQQQVASVITTLGHSYWDETNGLDKLKTRQRYNYAIQGSCAEGLKKSLALFTKDKLDSWKLVSAIHDEIIIEVPEEEALTASKCLEQSMIAGMRELVKKVPIEVSVNISKIWEK